jgi:hypothetical protein
MLSKLNRLQGNVYKSFDSLQTKFFSKANLNDYEREEIQAFRNQTRDLNASFIRGMSRSI